MGEIGGRWQRPGGCVVMEYDDSLGSRKASQGLARRREFLRAEVDEKADQ